MVVEIRTVEPANVHAIKPIYECENTYRCNLRGIDSLCT